ncbi:MAG: hypothetical protein MHPSP_000280 [Paramarteilia canceri]
MLFSWDATEKYPDAQASLLSAALYLLSLNTSSSMGRCSFINSQTFCSLNSSFLLFQAIFAFIFVILPDYYVTAEPNAAFRKIRDASFYILLINAIFSLIGWFLWVLNFNTIGDEQQAIVTTNIELFFQIIVLSSLWGASTHFTSIKYSETQNAYNILKVDEI